MYTLARAMLWRYGYLDKLFAVLGHTDAIDVKYGKVKGLRTQTADTDAATKLFAETILKFGTADDAFGSTEGGTILEVIQEAEDEDGWEEDGMEDAA